MHLRPFSLPLSIGTDICQISRIQAVLNGTAKVSLRKDAFDVVDGFAPGRQGNTDRMFAFLRRFLLPIEQELFWLRFKTVGIVYSDVNAQDVRSAGIIASSHLAGRFAAKEAAIKAYRAHGRLVSFSDIMIIQQPPGFITRNQNSSHNLHSGLFGILLDPERKAKRQHLPDGWRSMLASKGSLDHLDAPPSTQDDTAADDTDEVTMRLRRERRAFEELTKNIRGQKFQVSISHDGDYATAVCLAAHEPLPGDVGGEAAARMI